MKVSVQANLFSALFCMFVLGQIAGTQASATESKDEHKFSINTENAALADPTERVLSDKKFDHNSLHRLDFHIMNKTCGVCLLNIQTKTRFVPAVVNAAVMIKRPFCVSIIYDSKQISQEQLIKKVKSFEKDLMIDLVQDEAIAKPPMVLIPPHLGESETTESASH